MHPLPAHITPAVSVILPSYNRASYLPACIESVLAQSCADWELIVVDDGSSDHTFEVVNPYIQRLRHVRYLKHQNIGLALTKNIGIQVALGSYITFIDSDDTYKADHLQSRVAFLQSHPQIDLIEGGFATEEEVWVADFFDTSNRVNLRDCVLGPTFFGKRHVFFELNGFTNIAYGEDTDFWLRAEQQFATHKLSEPETYCYTRAAESITKRFAP